jgi:3'-5' exoribonuclease
MKHKDIISLQAGTSLESVYLLRDVMKKIKKNGEPYVSLILQDATGTVNAIMWDKADLFLKNEIKPGDFVLILADVGQYNQQLQITVREAKWVDPNMVTLEKFIPTSQRPLDEMHRELMEWIEQVKTPHLRSLLDSFFQDDKFLAAFLRAPSARTMHQAYVGGLAEHTLGVTKNAVSIADNYTGVNKDLLITGALLHDGFKVFEYSIKTTIEFTDKGRLLGHLCMMAMEIENRTRAIPDFPEESKTLLEHMILSHHGRREYGSPKVPMTAEALILFYADYIDAYLSTYFEQKQKAHKRGDKWTEWVEMFEGFLYAGENAEKKDNDDKEKSES